MPSSETSSYFNLHINKLYLLCDALVRGLARVVAEGGTGTGAAFLVALVRALDGFLAGARFIEVAVFSFDCDVTVDCCPFLVCSLWSFLLGGNGFCDRPAVDGLLSLSL